MRDYPDIREFQAQKITNSIVDRLVERGLTSESLITLEDIEAACPVTWELFKSIMNTAREYRKYVFRLKDEHHMDYFSYPSADIGMKMLDTIEMALLDNENHYISYFIHDLNFGEDWRPGAVLVDGMDFQLTSDEELWELLMLQLTLSVRPYLKAR